MKNTSSVNMDYLHNRDIDPPDDYLAALPRVRLALHHPALLDLFIRYDEIANSKQRLFRIVGMTSLAFAGVSLVGISVELLLGALGPAVPWQVTMMLELLALMAIFLVLGLRLAGVREKWLTARFMTEQLRQWHFQMLLDGNLISKACVAPAAFTAE